MSVGEKNRFRIPLHNGPVRSLCWNGDELLDMAAGGTRFLLDGSTVRAGMHWAYRFDRTLVSSDRESAVIYETLGTKGLAIRGKTLVREINRSFYCAQAYEFPVAVFSLPDGGTAIAHCPEEYNRLEIEKLESGEKLTTRRGESPDFFHSRLQVSKDGAYLLSAGWLWHPLDRVKLFSLFEALKRPEHLDNPVAIDLPDELFEVNAAAFQGNDALLLVGKRESDNPEASFVATYDIEHGKLDLRSTLETEPGTIMPVGRDHFVGFFEHPQLFEISSGHKISSWPDINSGKQKSSIVNSQELPPPMALDPEGKRFAVADPRGITVIQLG